MSASMEFTDDEYALCKRQSYAVSRKWKAADAADIEADLLLWMCVNYGHVERYRTEPGGRQKLGKALYRHGLQRAMKEQEAHNGRRLQDEWSPYTKEQVKAALPYIWDREDWPTEQAVIDPRHGGTVGVRGNSRVGDAVSVLLDVSAAVEKLSAPDQQLLRLRYRDGFSTREIAEQLGTATGAVSRRLWDAVDRVHARLSESAYRTH